MTRVWTTQHEGQENAEAAGDFLFPDRWEAELQAESQVENVPHRSCLYRANIHLDIAAMLQHRSWLSKSRPAFRYLAYDASPQHGSELFGTVERVILAKDVLEHLRADETHELKVHQRKLPVCQLGVCRLGAAEKGATLLHQTWLEYGPSADEVRLANWDVRSCLSDMGTELAIVDMADITSQCLPCTSGPQLRQRRHLSPHLQSPWLFPNALGVPGCQHVTDLCLRKGVEQLPWWPEWQADAKVVAQWMKPKGKRLELIHRLKGMPISPLHLGQYTTALGKTINSFAEWRWQTLHTVLSQLGAAKDAVVMAVSLIASPKELGSRDQTTASKFLAAVRSPLFWARVSLLRRLTKPLSDYAGWLRGCECHEEERKARKKVSCQWAGCRATTIAERSSQLQSQLLQLRVAFTDTDGADERQLAAAVTRVVDLFRLKTSWMTELAFTVWELNSSEKAAEFLARFDTASTPGSQVHRVARRFGEPGGEFRADMEVWAESGRLKSEELAGELMGYQLAKLDDTWQEAVHKDISNYCGTASAAAIPRVAAWHRSKQNHQLARATAGTEFAVTNFVVAWKSICQPNVARARRLIPPRWLPSTSAMRRVYRCDDSCMVDWTLLMQGQLFQDDEQIRVAPTTIVKMQIEHLSAVLEHNTIFSCARASSTPPSQLFFQAVDLCIERKKLKKDSDEAMAMRGMAKPISVQWMSVWPGGDAPAGSGTIHLIYDGVPEVVDMVSISSWPHLQQLERWSLAASPPPGLLAVEDSRPALPSSDWQESGTPVLSLLHELTTAGWKRTLQPTFHTLTSPKVFHADDPLGRKAYLRCLVGWDTLVRRGLTELPSTALVSYYLCVLAADRPGDVPQNASGLQYAALLQGRSIAEEPLPIADRELSQPSQLVVCARSDQVDDEPPPTKKQRTTRSRVAASGGDDWGCLVDGMEKPEESAPVTAVQVVQDWLAAGSAPPDADPAADGLLQLVPQVDEAPVPVPRRRRRASTPSTAPPTSTTPAASTLSTAPATSSAAAASTPPAAKPAPRRAAPAAKRGPRHRTPVNEELRERVLARPTIYLFGVRVGLESEIDLRARVRSPHAGHEKQVRTRLFTCGSDETAAMGDAEAYVCWRRGC